MAGPLAYRGTMLFNSLTFLAFFAVVFGVHSLPLPWRVKKINLVVASYVFYAAWHPPYVVLLAISTLVAWFVARGIAAEENPAMRRLLLVAGLCIDLGMLGYFKYAAFLAENFVRLADAVGLEWEPPRWNILLPIGISFYTFHTLSYTIDVYRRRFDPWPSFVDFALYVSFFPQLVAGPITRGAQFLPQCVAAKRATFSEFAWGTHLFIIGLFLKIVLADRIFRPLVDAVYEPTVVADTTSSWSGMAAFCGQIYCDFAGYSTCAIGAALCLGFALPDNFRRPLAPLGFIDFWQRWHISLSTWLRDYVYFSLGGNQRGVFRSAINILATMVLAGLWHGAAWTFVTFGALNGLAILCETGIRSTRISRAAVWQTAPARLVLAALTLLLLGLTCVFFRATSMEQAIQILAAMAGAVSASAVSCASGERAFVALIVLEVIFVIHFTMRETSLEEFVPRLPAWVWGFCLTLLVTLIAMTPGEDTAFVYFQF